MRFDQSRAHHRVRALLACLTLLGACTETTAADPDAARNSQRGGPVTRVDVVSSDGSGAPTTVVMGSTVKLGVRTWDDSGNEVSGRKVVWSVSTPATASINPSGTLATKAVGAVQVIAAVEGVVRTHSLEIASTAGSPPTNTTPAPVPPSGPTSATSIAAAIVRFDGGSGETVVSTGVPLVPGALRPGQEGTVRVTVGGTERPVHVAALSGTHADGSLRAVLVQLRATVSTGTALPARVELGTERAASFTLASPVAAVTAVPGTALLPTDAAYLIATDIVGATIPASATTAMGGAWARYETDFAQYADHHWTTYGDAWEHNYYDRALAYYAQWARTADPTYWHRGTRHAYTYRANYLEPNNGMPSPHWSQLEGLEKHYLLTGDEKSRYAVARAADVIWGAVQNNGGIGPSNDPRIAGRVLLGTMLAWRLGGHSAIPVNWSARLDEGITKVEAWQSASGLYDSGPLFCGGQYNFMVGLLNDALTKVHTYYEQDPRIVTLVKRSVDYMWTTQWLPTQQAFQYGSVACPEGGTDAAGDLTGLIIAPYGWVYKQTGDAAYRTRGDELWAAMVAKSAPLGPKQFNQYFTSSWRYLGYR